ncbi:hypothetical protein MKW98_025057 [Papaver atlanticum]|uniref:Sulfite exporter TauE/SafE family protein n=1 Tax=Papaver atlanticum TaxID=357466 RepID=A0AAD4S6U2_9MAGN|nr:hypothetical protein MKW98_025057 [Papaver atlanticum]
MSAFKSSVRWLSSSSSLVVCVLCTFLLSGYMFASAERSVEIDITSNEVENVYVSHVRNMLQKGIYVYRHVWPEMKFGWKIVVGTIIGFIGAACGSVGGVGGGGIYVPMLTLIIGFDAKTSVPISKLYYNLKRRHPTLEMPVIDYNLTLLIQPILMLGISIATSTMSFFKGVETWKKESRLKKEVNCLESNGEEDVLEDNPLAIEPSNDTSTQKQKRKMVPILENVYWKELAILISVWVAYLVLQIFKNKMVTCSMTYWILSSIQGEKVIASLGEKGTNWKVHQLIFYSAVGVFAGVVGGLLGMGGGFILGPLFLQVGIPPQVSTATASFAMLFSSSMSVVEYYLLKRFPVPYALYFFAVATLSALAGQHVVRKIISILGRASLIIFILSITIFVSAIFLGGDGVANMTRKIEHKQYLGFEKLCQ